jgi:hypothetical protein
MTSQQFAFWLQGFFEISNEDTNYTGELNRKQVQMIEKHLSLVFTHEIDPSHGPKEHTDKLDVIHNSPPEYMLKPPHSYKDLYPQPQHDQRPRC